MHIILHLFFIDFASTHCTCSCPFQIQTIVQTMYAKTLAFALMEWVTIPVSVLLELPVSIAKQVTVELKHDITNEEFEF